MQGDEAEAQRLAAEAAICFETGAEVQRDRLASREQTATNEGALLAHLLEQAEAMRAVAEGTALRSDSVASPGDRAEGGTADP